MKKVFALKGFTLVETLVAISVLLLVIIGPMTVAQKGIQNAYFANERATAVFLAQEAIEEVREYRDAEALNEFHGGDGDTTDWISGAKNDLECSNCKLYLDGGRYTESGSAESDFSRTVVITNEGGGIVSVDVTVLWESYIFGGGASTREVKLQTWIYDQYRRYGN